MIYAYRTGALLPEGCVGHYVAITTHNYSSELFGDAGLVMQSNVPLDMSRKKVLDGAIVDMTAEECAIMDAIDEAARIATITPALWQTAALFRSTLRKHFGDNAETNHEVTAQAVKEYFVAKQQAGTITASEAADSVFLAEAFDEIKAWTGDGTSWSFPWSYLS
jgi:hypothetical protein